MLFKVITQARKILCMSLFYKKCLHVTQNIIAECQVVMWAQAKLLGDARIKSNDSTRAVDQDREDEETIDTCGAFGELFLYQLLLNLPDVTLENDVLVAMREHLYNPDGGATVEDVDCELSDGGIDVKTFCYDDRKQRFVINAAKHKALEKSCTHYLWRVRTKSLCLSLD